MRLRRPSASWEGGRDQWEVLQPRETRPREAVPDRYRNRWQRRHGLRRPSGRAAEIHDRGAEQDLRLPRRLRAGRVLRAAVGQAGERGASGDDDAHRGRRAGWHFGKGLGRNHVVRNLSHLHRLPPGEMSVSHIGTYGPEPLLRCFYAGCGVRLDSRHFAFGALQIRLQTSEVV